jgi:hypothetical protein
VREREGADHQHQPAQRTAEQQQADQELEMVGSNQNVMNAGAGEPLSDRQHALLRPGEILHRAAVPVEHRLRAKRRSFVDIHEGLVERIVGKQARRDADDARRARQHAGEEEAERLSVGQRLPPRPRRRIRPAVDVDTDAPAHHRFDGPDSLPDHGLVEHPLGPIDLDIVRQIEGMEGMRRPCYRTADSA